PKGVVDYVDGKDITITALSDKDVQADLLEANETHGIYFCPNAGGSTDASITRFVAFYCEWDNEDFSLQSILLENARPQPSIVLESKRGYHAYWLIDGECSESEWRTVQALLITHFDSDRSIKNPARVMRLPFFDHLSLDSGELSRKPILLHTLEPERK